MRRRAFIAGAASAVAMPYVARAQQKMPVIGFLAGINQAVFASSLAAFRAGLNETGFFEGRNVAIEYRWADGDYQRLPAMAAELVQRRVAVIVAAGGNAPAFAVKAATSTIPMVFSTGSDPVKVGLVTSMSRPGGNITGASILTTALETKRLELLHEVVPNVRIVGVLVNPDFSDAELQIKELQAAAQTFGKQIVVGRASDEAGIRRAFTTFVEARVGALMVASDPFLFLQTKQIVELASIHALPAIYLWREATEAGGLMSYGTHRSESYRLVGNYAGRILKGENPGDLPVIQSTKVEFVVNLKTAKTLGLTIPTPLSGRADEVIE